MTLEEEIVILRHENNQLRLRLNFLIDTACTKCQARERKALGQITRERLLNPPRPEPPGEMIITPRPDIPGLPVV